MTPPVRTWLVTLALVGTSLDVAAQSLLCDTVKPGDTASGIAWRFTGRADSRYQPWFHIVDRERSRVVPKAAYDRILSGWQACVPAARLAPPVSAGRVSGFNRTATIPASEATPSRALQMIAAPVLMTGADGSGLGVLELVLAILGLALGGAAIATGWQRFERSMRSRESLKREVQFFGQLFVMDFERPLVIDGVASRPIHARLRWASHRRRLDILLAPAAGRRYPNLEDHKRNVEYDVDRIANRLRHHPFVRRPLRAEGAWVVVPFQLKSRPHTGARI